MAEDYILSEDVVSAAPGRFEKFLKMFIVLGILFLGGELIWLVGVSPFRRFSRIDVSGYDGLSRERILGAAGITGDSSYFSTDAKAAEQALMDLTSLESVRIIKHFPDRLQIVLEGRRAVASALVNLNGRTVPALFDSHGVIFRIGRDEADESASHQLPVISGLTVEDPVPGTRLPVMFIPLFAELEKIEISAPELLAAVSELKVSQKSSNTFDLILYPVHKKIKVRLSELNEDLLRYTLLMVDVLAAKEPDIETLDFRSGIASYIPKEASSEQ